LIEPSYIGTLFQTHIGLALVAACFVSGTIGFLFIRKITTIEV
jgi:tight adherence protein B